MASRSWIIAAVTLALLALGGCEDDFIEVCTPTTTEIVEAAPSAVDIQLRSGDRPLRGKAVTVEIVDPGGGVTEREIDVGTDGSAHIDLGDEAPAGADVTIRFAGDDTYCESSATREINRVGTDQP